MPNVILNRKLQPLYLSSLVSKTGDFAYEVAFAIIAINLLSSNILQIGTIYFFRFIPYLFFGPVGGWIADNAPQKRVMILSDTLRFIVATALYTIYISEELNIYALVACSMLMTIARSLFQPSFRAYLPSVLAKKDLAGGNSLIQVIEDVASILGPLACALIISTSDKGNVILLHSISYALSISLLLFLEKSNSTTQKSLSLSSLIQDIKGISRSKQNSSLIIVIVGTSICILFTAALLRFVLPTAIITTYNNEALVGYIFSIMSAGTVLGGICYTTLVKSSNPAQLMKAWMTYGLLFLATSIVVTVNLSSTMFIMFFLGMSGAIVDISIVTNIQTLSLKGDIGKNYGMFSTLANTCEAASGFISGLLSLVLGTLSFPATALLIALAAKLTLIKMKVIQHEKNKS